ncbi:MAG: C39 family peptidase [Nitrospiraceae bacterium]|nr:MAG: C39 family peptidase [Nitrospiraceae bacterium]
MKRLEFNIQTQPTDTTCGPACLHAVYKYFDDTISLEQVIQETAMLREGGTLAVFLACHALKLGYSAHIYTYNLNVFDPTWFPDKQVNIREKLEMQIKVKDTPILHEATRGYLEFLSLGGTLSFQDLTPSLIRKYLNRGLPILTGLSSTYLYRCAREYGYEGEWDDIKGIPAGHFVILCGYDKAEKTVMVADPFLPNPYSESHHYMIGIERVLCSILLGVLTYDANLLIIMPKKPHRKHDKADTDNR